LAKELRSVSHNRCSTKTANVILDTVKVDGNTIHSYQSSRDVLTRSLVRDLAYYKEQLNEVKQAIKALYPVFECILMTMPGIDIATVTNMLYLPTRLELRLRIVVPNRTGLGTRLNIYGMLKNKTEYREPSKGTKIPTKNQ